MKKYIIVLLAVLVLTLTGCRSNRQKPTFVNQNITPNLMSLSETNYDYFYIVDKNTGVVYFAFSQGYGAGITVVMKPDGTPMLAEDLGIAVVK